ncbi:DUF262 domain-containing protein [Cryobacterium cheniae]|uniref:DUF262 domain-containing protein n=1 Tax=Cryobacterium cheniae TaxID=1259262 RepID=A0A4R8XLU7_9MICO|nr:DUF262 domain-containing protein [Cryobacterium cheniae]TFC75812.1 DUF262 domain-containing protein [Cryobacterium cheniae]
MKADALTPRDLFDGKVHYEIPAFQRPYVWNEEDQWAPLWDDVERVALAVLKLEEDEPESTKLPTHFLGAVVVKTVSAFAGDVSRHIVIDGQQRMTTIQLLLDAAQLVVEELGYEDEAEALSDLILNEGKRFAGKRERFKLWPCRADRVAFESTMDSPAGKKHGASRVAEAHAFFQSTARSWVVGAVVPLEGSDGDESLIKVPGTEASRARALAQTLQSHLYLVSINLGVDDDDQLIFETLNDRGTPLLAADLIKNWVFQRGEDLHADTENWAETLWLEFDDDWWRETISQGRHLRSRVDIFLQYWLTMREREEVLTEGVFRAFRDHAAASMKELSTAESFLQVLSHDAATFRGFAELDPDSSPGRFYSRVVESLELAATIPLLLWMLSSNHDVPGVEISKGLQALESWVIRRTMLRYTMKDINRLMVSLLSELDTSSVHRAGDVVREFLSSQTADSRFWPSDETMVRDLPSLRLYGNVRQGRLRVVLEGIEMQQRTERHENTQLPHKLEIEHVMPQGWRAHWDATSPLDDVDAAERDKRVNTLGNLTLVTKKLNGTLSHRPWTDRETWIVAPTGKDQGRGKRTLLSDYSLLVLNKDLVGAHPESWSDDDIEARGVLLTQRLCRVWPC